MLLGISLSRAIIASKYRYMCGYGGMLENAIGHLHYVSTDQAGEREINPFFNRSDRYVCNSESSFPSFVVTSRRTRMRASAQRLFLGTAHEWRAVFAASLVLFGHCDVLMSSY
jgi:hypothetical protein